ncbi:MAG: DUF4331 family protein [Candidatus Eisenbacteria bacterium]|nr:DUF4331 family protein [Candidatus Eisenbacteria bacterium]
MLSANRRSVLALAMTIGCGAALFAGPAPASDHQDTPEVELNPKCDINDVYAFPGSSPSRICLVMTTSSPIAAGATSPSFDPDKLYQLKVDNSGDGVEDLVLQFVFEGTGSGQKVTMFGPAEPAQTGQRMKVLDVNSTLNGGINSNLGAGDNVQVFAGLRDDPFFLDLQQFFRILPDRRPVTGPLAVANPISPAAWRNPATDYLAGFNTLAIVVELPLDRLTVGGNAKFGVWGTISR